MEFVERKDYISMRNCGTSPTMTSTINTIYFGGGTPSLLSVEEISGLLHLINTHYEVVPNAEITIEANPDTLSLEYLEGLQHIGINRLSIGIQSFFDNDLNYLSRRHNSNHARQCIIWAKQAGFNNISIDLIYGLPTSNANQWNHNLDLFFEMDLPHLSAYALTLEPNSILTKLTEQGKALPICDEDALRDYDILCRRVKEKGYLHYEISNFCQPGMHSKHNASYWFGTPYVGFGPSAHSYDGHSRQWNMANVEKYCSFSFAYEKEQLTPEQHYNEYVMLRLRTHWGIDLKYMKREMGEVFSSYCDKQAQPLIAQGYLTQTREFLYLTDKQMLFADGIAETLFWEE